MYKIRSNGRSLATLDKAHRHQMSKFTTAKKSLPTIQKRYNKKTKELRRLNDKHGSEYTNDDIIRRSTLKDELQKLQCDIDEIKNDYDEMEYYDTINETLKEYYDLMDFNDVLDSKDELDNVETMIATEVDSECQNNDKSDMLELANQAYKKKTKKKAKSKTTKKRRGANKRSGPTIIDYFTTGNTSVESTTDTSVDDKKKKINKATLNRQYRMLVDHDYVEPERTVDDMYVCDECENERILVPREGFCVCKSCGSIEYVMIDCDRSSNKDSMSDKPGYPYKRINHFNEWLSQFQAKENTEIPESVYANIQRKLKQIKVSNYRRLNYKMVKNILKRLKYQSYYEHIPYIICKLNGLPPPTIGQKNEERLREMFKEIQAPFQLYCPKDRVNFLSYSYVLHKLCELIELDDVLECFPLLKSREKLRQQDKIWKQICGYCLWQFIPCV